MLQIEIVYQDKDLLVVEKPSGLVVNRAESVTDITLQDLLSSFFKLPKGDLGIGGRAGIVHRLDRETSGLLLVATTERAFVNLQSQFKERLVEKKYLGLCHGRLQNEGVISAKLARNPKKLGKFLVVDSEDEQGREAETHYQSIKYLKIKGDKVKELAKDLEAKNLDYYKQFSFLTYVSLFPKSGRTHQIRVHLKSLQRPIVSDKLYLGERLFKFDLKWCPRLFLHAQQLTFRHPTTKKSVSLTSDLPKDLLKALNYLEEVN